MDETGPFPAGMGDQGGAPLPRVAPERLAQARRLARAWVRLQEEAARLRPDGSAEPDVPGAAEAEPETDELAALERRMDALCRRAAALEGVTPLRQSAPLQALARALAADLDPERQPPPPRDATPAEAPAPAVPPSDVPCADVSPPEIPPSEMPPSEMPPGDMVPAEMALAEMAPAEMYPLVVAGAPAAGPMLKGSARPVPPPRGARRRLTGAAIGLGVALLVVGALLSHRSIAPVPAVGRPGSPAATQPAEVSGHADAAADVGAGPERNPGRTVGVAAGSATPIVVRSRPGAPVDDAGVNAPVVAVPVVAVASAGARDGALRPGRAVAAPVVPMVAPAAVPAAVPAPWWYGPSPRPGSGRGRRMATSCFPACCTRATVGRRRTLVCRSPPATPVASSSW